LKVPCVTCFRAKGKTACKGKNGGVSKSGTPGLLTVQRKKSTVSNKIEL